MARCLPGCTAKRHASGISISSSRDNTAMRMRIRALRPKRRRVPGLVNSELAAVWQADGGH